MRITTCDKSDLVYVVENNKYYCDMCNKLMCESNVVCNKDDYDYQTNDNEPSVCNECNKALQNFLLQNIIFYG